MLHFERGGRPLADPHVAYVSISKDLVPVTDDSDLLAYGAKKLIVVKSYARGWYGTVI